MAKGKPKKTRKAPRQAETPKATPALAPTKREEVKISAAKGRPMLTWVGKRPLRHVVAFPAQHVETFDPSGDTAKRGGDLWKDWPEAYPRGGLLFHGDNKEVLAHLLANGFRGKVNLIYIDPPFDSGADYVRKVNLRGPKGTVKLGGEGYTLGEQLQYTDIWANDNYLQFMYERFLLLKELLSPFGSIYLHCDWHRSHLLRGVMDEVFGADSFINEIIWRRADAHNDPGRFGMIHDTLLYYAPAEQRRWTALKLPLVSAKLETDSHYVWDPARGKYFRLVDLRGPGDRGPRYEYKGVDRHWKWSREKLEEADRRGELYFTKNGVPFYRLWIENEEIVAQDIWMDIPQIKSGDEKENFPTQKPEALLERIILASTAASDIVLDGFVGSGTTAAVAQKLGRRWIGCDINRGAIQTTSKRLHGIILEEIGEAAKAKQESLPGADEPDALPPPAQLSFAVFRVNDYDLTVHHEEVAHLACEHIGVTRTRTDAYFDGVRGKSLVKVVPFSHPLTLLDLEQLKRELEARPEEERGILLVCLGKEPAADAWIDDWNRLRRGKDAVNRIEIIELRTDPKYGKFFQHQPAKARVKASRKKDGALVEIEDFISPTVVERLQAEAGLLKPKIDDWRAMVDCVLIDADFDGKVFRIGLSDVPEKKTDLVAGRYELPAPVGKTIAVKIIDMLGEEVLVTLHLKE
jgi:DNA modification methylase